MVNTTDFGSVVGSSNLPMPTNMRSADYWYLTGLSLFILLVIVLLIINGDMP